MDKYTTVTLTTDCHTDFLGKLYIQIRKMNMNVFLRYFKTKHYQLITLKPTNVCVRCANTEKVITWFENCWRHRIYFLIKKITDIIAHTNKEHEYLRHTPSRAFSLFILVERERRSSSVSKSSWSYHHCYFCLFFSN